MSVKLLKLEFDIPVSIGDTIFVVQPKALCDDCCNACGPCPGCKESKELSICKYPISKIKITKDKYDPNNHIIWLCSHRIKFNSNKIGGLFSLLEKKQKMLFHLYMKNTIEINLFKKLPITVKI